MPQEEPHQQESEFTPEYLENRDRALEASGVVRQFLERYELVNKRGASDPMAVPPLQELRNLLNSKLESA